MTGKLGIGRFALTAVAVSLASCASRAESGESLPSALEAGWKAAKVCEELYRQSDRRVLRCTFPPGVGHERHFHPRHFGYALTGGTMQITDANGTRVAEIEPGSSFSSEGIVWHEGVNIGDTTVTYLMFEEL